MNNQLIKENVITGNELLQVIKLCIGIRITYMIAIFIIGIIICFAMFDIAKELQHIAYHIADGTCCSLHL